MTLCFFFFSFHQPTHAEPRIWKDKSGKFEVRGEFVKVKDRKAWFKKSDGKVVSTSLAKLRAEDQLFIRNLVKEQRKAQKDAGHYQHGNPRSRSQKQRTNDPTGYSVSVSVSRETEGENFSRRSFSSSSVTFSHGSAEPKTQHRTWTDATGKYKIKADFVSFVDGKVKLQRQKDKKVISLPIAKLSDSDQRLARRLAKLAEKKDGAGNPFAGSSEVADANSGVLRRPGEYFEGDIVEVDDPFNGWKTGTVTKSYGDKITVFYKDEGKTGDVHLSRIRNNVRMLKANPLGVARSSSGTPLSPADFSQVYVVAMDKESQAPFSADAALDSQLSNAIKGFPVIINEDSSLKSFANRKAKSARDRHADFRARMQNRRNKIEHKGFAAFTPLPDKSLLFVGAQQGGFGTQSKGDFEVSLYDINTGAPVLRQKLGMKMSHATISPSGNKILTVEEGEFSNSSETITVWNVGAEKLERRHSWRPIVDELHDSVEKVQWVNDQQIVLASYSSVYVWNVEDRRLLWQFKANRGFGLSGNRRHLAVNNHKEIVVFDLASGQVVRRVESNKPYAHGLLSFSPSGSFLAISHGHGTKIDLVDLESGKIVDTLNLQSKANENLSFFWTDDEHILIGGRELIHVPSKIAVWTYRHRGKKVAYSHGLTWFLLQKGIKENPRITALRLPHPEVANIKDEQLALRPGDAVSLELELVTDFTGSGGRSIREDTIQKLTKDMEEAGYLRDADAPVTLLAVMEPGEKKKIRYTRFGSFDREGETVEVTMMKYRLELRKNRKLIWQREQVQAPSFHLDLEKGESIKQAVNRVMQPDAGYYGLGIPSRIMKPEIAKTRYCSIGVDGLEQ